MSVSLFLPPWPGLTRGPSAHGLDPWASTESRQLFVNSRVKPSGGSLEAIVVVAWESKLPHGVAIVILGPSGAALGRRVRDLLPGASLHGPSAVPGVWDETYDRAMPHLAELFAAGRPIVGLCASGILIRALAPLIDDKRAEPPVVALAEDGSVAVPLLGGHHGANALARALADALGCVAAITTAGDLRLGVALDETPPGWRIANPERVKPIAAALIAGRPGG